MGRYRKRPVVVEAFQLGNFSRTDSEIDKFEAWARAHEFIDWVWDGVYLSIHTEEGWMQASPTDWIVKGVAGEFYPVKDAIFRQSYDPVEET